MYVVVKVTLYGDTILAETVSNVIAYASDFDDAKIIAEGACSDLDDKKNSFISIETF